VFVVYPEFQQHLDFVVANVENVREAINDGAVRIDDEPAAELLARLEGEARAASNG
jgi:anti-sigma28 factor (negative regulator of flagellin synthesis)